MGTYREVMGRFFLPLLPAPGGGVGASPGMGGVPELGGGGPDRLTAEAARGIGGCAAGGWLRSPRLERARGMAPRMPGGPGGGESDDEKEGAPPSSLIGGVERAEPDGPAPE